MFLQLSTGVLGRPGRKGEASLTDFLAKALGEGPKAYCRMESSEDALHWLQAPRISPGASLPRDLGRYKYVLIGRLSVSRFG